MMLQDRITYFTTSPLIIFECLYESPIYDSI
nr:MAG TPA: hypothetical protein [Caudoviricetes sp.]